MSSDTFIGDSDPSDAARGTAASAPTVVFIKHPRVEEFDDVKLRIWNSLGGYVVGMALAPNYNASPLSVAPNLHRAFDTSAAFGNPSSALLESGGSAALMPRGYAVKVDGAMPIDSEERVYHALGAWNTGLGTSMYEIDVLPDHFRGGDNAALKAANLAAREEQPHLISPAHRISVGRTTSALSGDKYALFVTANDVPAAGRITRYVAARAASEQPLELETLLTSPEYKDVQHRSQEARDLIARTYAAAHKIKLADDGRAVHTTMAYSASRASDAAHGAHDSLDIHDARESRYYVLYNDAVDASQASDGRVLLHHGIMGGHTLLSNKADGVGGAWRQPHALSIMPTSSAEAHEEHTRAKALHTNQSEQTKQAFAARITWHSDLGDQFVHSAARETYYAMTDPYTARWLTVLSPSEGYATVPLEQQHYSVIAGQLPNISTLYMSTEELGRLARKKATPQNIPVALDNPVVARIPALYDQVIRAAGHSAKLHAIFRDVYEQDAPPGSFGRLYEPSALDTPVSADLFADAEQFGLSRRTGFPVKTLPNAGTAAVQMMSPDEIDALRAQIPPEQLHAPRTQTVININKDLLKLITAMPARGGGGVQ